MLERVVIASLLFCSFAPSQQRSTEKTVKLNVAAYAWLPEAAAAIEKLEELFEKKSKGIDLELELFDPYSKDRDEYKVLKSLDEFDIVEIDFVMLDEALRKRLEPIPEASRVRHQDAVGPAATILKEGEDKWIVPHWVCGNFLVYRAGSFKSPPTSWVDLRKSLSPSQGRPLFVDLYGGGTVGELYADAVLDLLGPAKARDHLLAVLDGKSGLHEDAASRVIGLGAEMTAKFRNNLSYFHNLSQVYPGAFADHEDAMLLGYSERMYYVERKLQLSRPGSYPPITKPGALVVTQFAFGEKSQGTPTWIDGFVIPKRKGQRTADKTAAIRAFLDFILTDEAYMAFLKPRKWGPAAYLLPALGKPYTHTVILKEAPLLPSYLKALDGTFPVDSLLYKGLDAAGEKLKARLKTIYLGK